MEGDVPSLSHPMDNTRSIPDLPSGVWYRPQSQKDQGQSDKTRLGMSWSFGRVTEKAGALCDRGQGMVATERPRLVTEAHLKRNKLVSDLYKTALMTKQLKIPLGAFLVPSNIPCAIPRPGRMRDFSGTSSQCSTSPGRALSSKSPSRPSTEDSFPSSPSSVSWRCLCDVLWLRGSSFWEQFCIATTLPIPEAPQGEPSSSRRFRRRRFQTGASPARVPETLEKVLTGKKGADPNEGVGEKENPNFSSRWARGRRNTQPGG